MIISSSVLIAAFAFVNQSREQQQQRRRRHRRHSGRTTRAFVARELDISPSNNNRLPHRTALLLASSSESEDGNGEAEGGSSSSSEPDGVNSSFENEDEASPSANGENINESETVAATRRAKVTRITSKNGNPLSSGNATSTSASSKEYDDDHSSTTIRGLPPSESFHLQSRIHCTLTLLRKHFPTLLELPSLSPSAAKWIYEPNVLVTGPGDEELAAGLDEVLLLSGALAAAATAAGRAGSLLDLATGTSSPSGMGKLECELLVDPDDPLRVAVLWRTRLPSIGLPPAADDGEGGGSPSSSYTEFAGRSTADLCPRSGLVTKLRIRRVTINGAPVVESLGTALAAVRRAARSAMATASLLDEAGGDGRRGGGNPLLDGILNGIRDAVAAADAPPPEEDDGGRSDSPLYAAPRRFWDGATMPMGEGFVFVPADDYDRGGARTTPLVGSEAFVEYAANRAALQSFAERGLRRLAGVSAAGSEDAVGVSTEAVRSLFAADAELATSGGAADDEGRNGDPTTLLRGAGRVADLYRSLALLREASGGDWRVRGLDADPGARRLVVRWGTESPLRIEGTDAFDFEAPPPTSSRRGRLPLGGDGDRDEVAARCASYFEGSEDDGGDRSVPPKISRIENLRLTIAGVPADSAWAQSFVSAALRSGIAENAPLVPDATITELLRALVTKNNPSAKRRSPLERKETSKRGSASMPALDEAAAASFYGIIRALHDDLPNIAGAAGASGPSSFATPAGDFLAETVELRGLLGEVLVRGRPNYSRLLRVAASSLRAAVRTRAVRLAAEPRPTVTVTPRGSIEVNLVLALRVATAPNLGGRNDDDDDGGFGVPLKIEVSSEYVVDGGTGRIREHRILESRLNGVLTPGDVFSRWIRGLAGEGEEVGGANEAAPSAMGSLMDAISWVRSMQDRK